MLNRQSVGVFSTQSQPSGKQHKPAISVSFRLMDISPIGAGAFGLVVGLSFLVQLAWHVAVLVFVYKIWQKVKHLPS